MDVARSQPIARAKQRCFGPHFLDMIMNMNPIDGTLSSHVRVQHPPMALFLRTSTGPCAVLDVPVLHH